jgi:hypothetical protein
MDNQDKPGCGTRPARTGLYMKSANGLKLRHRRVRRLVEKIRDALPWLEASDVPAARAWAELEILAANAFAELITNGLTNDQGEPRRLLTEFRQLRQAQLAYERDLGMTPASRIAIKSSGLRVTMDLPAQLARLDSGQPEETIDAKEP